MAMADLWPVFDNMQRVQADLCAAVSLRLRREFGLPLVWVELMCAVAKTASCRVHEVSEQLGVSAGGASKLVDRLEAAGYCRRVPNPGDRRSSLLQLTPAGRQTFERASRAVDEELDRLLGAPLSAAQIRELAATLRDLRASGSRT
jgi:MarR family transcriptional regulator, organic hydroperoxide resistance regulator